VEWLNGVSYQEALLVRDADLTRQWRLPINEERCSNHELQEDGSFVLKARSA
jgi:hypothetical protein